MAVVRILGSWGFTGVGRSGSGGFPKLPHMTGLGFIGDEMLYTH